MKNEEKAKEIALAITNGYEVCEEYDCAYKVALEAMRWKDEQSAKEREALIDKACEWLSIHDNYSIPTHVLVEQLRQALKGGEQ